MQKLLALAAGACLIAGAAQAQIQPFQPIVGPKPEKVEAPKPIAPPTAFSPPRAPSVAQAHPFSPEGEAARERKANAAPPGGPFSPEAEAKRARAEAKRDKANSPF